MLVPTGEDIDASLRSLRVEFNDLDKQTTTTQVDRGKRLIAVRQLLELKNGRSKNHAGSDGLSPVGWHQWVRENLTISYSQACACIRMAISPKPQQKTKHIMRKRTSIAKFHHAWSLFPDDTKREIAEFVIAEVRRAQS